MSISHVYLDTDFGNVGDFEFRETKATFQMPDVVPDLLNMALCVESINGDNFTTYWKSLPSTINEMNDIKFIGLNEGNFLWYDGSQWINKPELRFKSTLGSYTASIYPPLNATANYDLYLPDSQGSSGQYLTIDSQGVMSWTTGSGAVSFFTDLTDATITSPVENHVIQYVSGKFQNRQTLILQSGTTNVAVELKGPIVNGSQITLTLPSSTGTAGQVLKTDGNGIMDWITPSDAAVSIAIGTGSISANEAVVIGREGGPSGVGLIGTLGPIAIGRDAGGDGMGNSSIAIGYSSDATAASSIAIGKTAKASAANNICIGENAIVNDATHTNTIVIGTATSGGSDRLYIKKPRNVEGATSSGGLLSYNTGDHEVTYSTILTLPGTSGAVTISAPTTVSADYTLKLPTAASPASGSVLSFSDTGDGSFKRSHHVGYVFCNSVSSVGGSSYNIDATFKNIYWNSPTVSGAFSTSGLGRFFQTSSAGLYKVHCCLAVNLNSATEEATISVQMQKTQDNSVICSAFDHLARAGNNSTFTMVQFTKIVTLEANKNYTFLVSTATGNGQVFNGNASSSFFIEAY